jgi:arylformamidase
MRETIDNPVKQIIDLSHELYDGMPNLGGWKVAFPQIDSFERTGQLTQGRHSYQSKMMLLPEHCGTHLDAPIHFVKDGLAINEVPLEQLVLPGHLLDFTHKKNGEAITIADFEAAERQSGRKVGPGVALVCWTGTDKVWGQPGFGSARPHVPPESAQWMVERKVTLFATDLIGMDDPEQWWDPTHLVWLSNGICMVQQLKNLDKLVGKQFLFVALPIKIRAGSGCPIRAVALEL